jgi:RNA polymerase sigma factor (sigma-70 family)
MMVDRSYRAEQQRFYRGAHPKLLRFLRYLLPDEHTAEDVAMEVWKAFMIKWNREAEAFAPSPQLLHRIARCRAANWWRDYGSKGPILYSNLEGLARVLTCADITDSLIARLDLSHAISQALDELPARQRQAVGLRYLCDFSMSEVGDLMGITPRGARKAVDHALMTLRGSAHLLAYAGPAIRRAGGSS